MHPPHCGKMEQTGFLVSSGDGSNTSRSLASTLPPLFLLIIKRTFCPGIPFFTITVCPSTTTFPLFGNSICSMIPSYTSPFFICCPFFLFFLSAAFNRRKAPGSPPKLSCRFVYSHFNFLRYLHLQSNRQNHHRNHLQSLPDNPV